MAWSISLRFYVNLKHIHLWAFTYLMKNFLFFFFKTSGDEIMMTDFTKNMKCCLQQKKLPQSCLHMVVFWVPVSYVKYATLMNVERLPFLWYSLSLFLWAILQHSPNTLWNLSVRPSSCYILRIQKKNSFNKWLISSVIQFSCQSCYTVLSGKNSE